MAREEAVWYASQQPPRGAGGLLNCKLLPLIPRRNMSMTQRHVDRRDFLKTTAAGAAALSMTAASYARVLGANERIGVGFIGVGGRCQAHLSVINRLTKENK